MSLKTLLFLTLAAVSLAAPSPSLLRVVVTPAATSSKSKDISLTATVTNPTDQDISFVKFNSIIDTLPTRSFGVTKDGEDVTFAGIKVYPDLEHPDSWVTIPAGQSVTAEHSIGYDYDFVSAGPGKYTFEPNTVFQFGSTPSEAARVQSTGIEIHITEVEGKAHTEQSTPVCDDKARKNFLAASFSEARTLAEAAASDITSHPTSAQYATYFGNSNRDTVWNNFNKISTDYGVRNLYCDDLQGYCSTDSGIVAYTWLSTDRNGNIVGSDIYACRPFWNFPETHEGTCSGHQSYTRGGVFLHEMSHAVSDSTDIYGCDNVKHIRDSQKVNNADNYACFGAQIYKDYKC